MESVKFVNQTPTNKVNELYREARSSGCAPGNYCKVQILGDERAGKTSLWKKLMGKQFDPQEPSTFGIDTQMCRVKDVDQSWQEREYEQGSEVADCVIWKFKNIHQSGHQNEDKQNVTKPDYVLHLLFGFCLLVLLLGFPEFMRLVGWSNCMKLAVCMAFVVLIATQNVQMYLTVKNVADAIFTINLIGGMLFTQNRVVPNFALGFVSFILTMQKGILGVCQIRMGQSIVLGTILVSYTSDDNANWLPMIDFEHCVCFAFGFAIGSGVFPYLATLMTNKADTSVFTRRSLALEDIAIVVVLVFSLTLVSSVCNNDKFILFIMAFCSGFGDEVGITLGQRCTISKYFIYTIMENRSVWSVPTIMYSWILVKLCHDSTAPNNVQFVINCVFGLLPLALAEWYRNHLHEYTSAALKVARRTEESTTGTMPLNLSLWDFAGQEFYYNTHHTFMSSHAVYIIVFDLVKFQADRCKQINRIQFWLDSVRQHSRSSVLLVGTHRDCVDNDVLQESQRHLKELLQSVNLVTNKQSCFFAVDNTQSLHEVNDDVDILRRKIHEEAWKVKHLCEEYPIKWREFSEFIKDSRSTTSAAHVPGFFTVSELRQVVDRYHITEMEELLKMLTFFHDNGDIIYDSVDSVLRQFVILDPQVMIDIMQAIVIEPEFPETKFRSAWQHFERTGFLEPSLLEHIIVSRTPGSNGVRGEQLQVMIGMLQAKDLICKIEGWKHSQNQDRYLVPSKLPEGPDLSKVTITWNRRYFISFGTLLPDAVFFRLICRCVSYSDIVSCGPDQCMIFKQGGLFTLGQNFLFMLRRSYPCKKQNVVEVSVKAVHSGCCLEVLNYLCRILETLRCRDFPNLRFQAGPPCCYDAPHQDCEGLEMLHILDVVPEMESENPVAAVFRQCNGRPIHIDMETVGSDESSDEDLHVDDTVMVSGNRSRIARHNVKATDSDFLDAIQLLGHDDTKKLFYALGLTHRDIDMGDNGNGKVALREDLVAIDVLQKWQKTQVSNATRQAILDALIRCDNIEAAEELGSKWCNKHEDTLSGSDFFAVVEMLRPYDLIKLLHALNIEQREIEKFSKDVLNNGVELRAMDVFQKWRKTKGPRATRQAIINGLRKCNNAEAEEELLELWDNKGSRKTLQEVSPELANVDVYISFSHQDEGWVLENLVRFLRETPHYLTVCLNQHDTATNAGDPRRHIRGRQQNAKQIASSKMFIAVSSRRYVADQTGRLKFEREVARNCKVPIIVVNLNSSTLVADLFDTESISFSKNETRQGECLDLLLDKINRILGA